MVRGHFIIELKIGDLQSTSVALTCLCATGKDVTSDKENWPILTFWLPVKVIGNELEIKISKYGFKIVKDYSKPHQGMTYPLSSSSGWSSSSFFALLQKNNC